MHKHLCASALGLVCLAMGCALPLTGTHATLHPSVDGKSSGAGVALGAVDVQTDTRDGMGSSGSSNVFEVPYSEGWARFGLGNGQLELRVGLPFATLGYRWNITDARGGGVGFALIPSTGLAYVRFENDTVVPGAPTQKQVDAYLTFAPDLTVLISFAKGRGYVAPHIGLIHMDQVAGAARGADTTTDALSFGGAVGWTFGGGRPFWYSFELSISAVDQIGGPGSSTSYYFAPTFGIHI